MNKPTEPTPEPVEAVEQPEVEAVELAAPAGLPRWWVALDRQVDPHEIVEVDAVTAEGLIAQGWGSTPTEISVARKAAAKAAKAAAKAEGDDAPGDTDAAPAADPKGII